MQDDTDIPPAQDESANNRRIAKNTMTLYVRMAFLMAIGFFTTREFLRAAGVEDFGLINLVAGIVMMLSFVSNMISTAASRFFSFEIGRKDGERLSATFSTIMFICVILSAVIILAAETVGLWAFRTYVDIPESKDAAANWLYHLTLLSFLLGLVAIPYRALIVSHESMKLFSFLSVLEALLKLAIVYALYLRLCDTLKFYGLLFSGMSLAVLAVYWAACRLKYPESKITPMWDKKMLKELSAFISWNFWGGFVGLLYNLVINVLLNNFFGAVLNAARAVSLQILTGVSGFTSNFMIAAQPQIVKYWAQGNVAACHALTLRASRFGFFLVLLIGLPVIIENKIIFSVWLDTVPDYSVALTRIILVQAMIDTLSLSLMALAQASGRIALYQTVVSAILFMNIPAAYVVIKLGYSPTWVMSTTVAISAASLAARLVLVRRCAKLSIRAFICAVMIPICKTSAAAALIPAAISMSMGDGLARFLAVGFASVICWTAAVAIFGVSAQEREMLINALRTRFQKTVRLNK